MHQCSKPTLVFFFFSYKASKYVDLMVVLCLQVLILSEKLHSVTAQFDQLRATRFQDIINRAMPRRKPKRIIKETNPVNTTLANSESTEPNEIQAQPRRIQQQLLDDETQALQVTRQFYMIFETCMSFVVLVLNFEFCNFCR